MDFSPTHRREIHALPVHGAVQKAPGGDRGPAERGDYGTASTKFFFRLAFRAQAVILRLPLVRIRKHEGNLSAQPMLESFDAVRQGVKRFYALGAITRQCYTERMMIYH